MGEWYYIGHYGQLGPLTREQIEELIDGGVIARDTFVWKSGMAEWMAAQDVADLKASFPMPKAPAPPVPSTPFPPVAGGAPHWPAAPELDRTPYPIAPQSDPLSPYHRYEHFQRVHDPYAQGFVPSDRSRALSGVLQFIVPGLGRIYLGYSAIGVLQLVTAFCGVGIIWSWIDGIVILANGLRLDGYGRLLVD